MTIYLLQYNNYYNRTIKREASLVDYLGYSLGDPITRVAFNPNDGVNTEQIINWPLAYGHPDYVLLVNEYNEIVSRWFVIDSIRLRSGQYRLMLRRDLIADFYTEVINAPVFIEKAKLRTTNNLIFNREDMTYNQILDRKIALMDETRVPWVVGYIPRDSFTQDTQIETTTYSTATTADIEVPDITTWEFYEYARPDSPATFKATNAALTFQLRFGCSNLNYAPSITAISSMSPGYYNVDSWQYTSTASKPFVGTIDYIQDLNSSTLGTATKYLFDNFRSKANWDSVVYQQIKRTVSGINDTETTYRFAALNGKTIKDLTSGAIFEIKVQSGEAITGNIGTSTAAGNVLKTNFEEQTRPIRIWDSYAFNSNAFGYSIPTYTMTLRQITTKANTTLNNTRYHLEDGSYDMFCIPAGDIQIYTNGVASFTCQGKVATAIATAIGEKTGAGNIYDIQLVPYCPIRYMLEDGILDTRSYFFHKVYSEDSAVTPISAIFWARTSSDNFVINESISVPGDPIDFKVANECDMFRLVSPNGNGMFEFKATKNNGVDFFEADFTYKPFNPFIHIKPNFGRLYGDNPEKDFRGLICGGDFSITQLSNAWANYQQQNVNLQNSFNRQIENLEVNNAIQRQKEIIGATLGAIGAGVSGSTTGLVVGGGYGAAIGGVAGTGISAAGGTVDIIMNEKLRAEALDYTKDQFGYQLGNIKALPTSLAKTGALVYSNTLFPTLEYYMCTQEERDALRNKITYNGMTVMVIDKIYKYLWNDPTYIKGKLIRLENVGEDYHIINAISLELDKGVFI